MSRQAHAKVNLFLEVLGKRPDGYHEIETVMVQVGLADEMSFSLREDGEVGISCEGLDVPPDENLAVKAARLLKKRSGCTLGMDIGLRKNVPVGAGLGGGSSDAAATLDAASELWELGLGREELTDLAAELGSDVPFFLLARAGVCRGRGEKVEPIETKGAPPLVLAWPRVQLSTKDVYASLSGMDLTRSVGHATVVMETLFEGTTEGLSRVLFNRLESAAGKLCPEVGCLKARLSALGARGAVMSGSGSAVAGLFSGDEAADRAAEELELAGYWVALTTFVR